MSSTNPSVAALQNQLLENAREREICESLHEVIHAETYSEMVIAGAPVFIWGYRSGYITNRMLSAVPETDLNAGNIFTEGNPELVNPADEIYIVGTAIFSLAVNTKSRVKVYVMGTATLNVVAEENSYVNIKAYEQSTVNITITDNAMCDIDMSETSSGSITQSGNATTHLKTTNEATISGTATGGTVLIRSFGQSSCVITGSAQIINNKLQNTNYYGPSQY